MADHQYQSLSREKKRNLVYSLYQMWFYDIVIEKLLHSTVLFMLRMKTVIRENKDGEPYLNGKGAGTASTSSTTAFSSRYNVHSKDLWWIDLEESSNVFGQVGSKEFVLCQWCWRGNAKTKLKSNGYKFLWNVHFFTFYDVIALR